MISLSIGVRARLPAGTVRTRRGAAHRAGLGRGDDDRFTGAGEVCTSNNPLPVSAMEGGVAELICVDPGR